MQVTHKAFNVEAMQFDGSIKSAEEIREWANNYLKLHPLLLRQSLITLDGDGTHAFDYMLYNLYRNTSAQPSDWVVRTREGNFIAVTNVLFEEDYEAYPPASRNGMDWSNALLLIKDGERVARSGWNGKDMFIFLVPGSRFQVNRKPLLGIYPEGTWVDYHGHIDMRTANGQIVPWLASQTDQLAEDWVLVS